MASETRLKIFISYSHKDEKQINKFKTHLAPLKNNGLVEDWYDRKISSGQDFQKKIENKLSDADIVCLFISANFLSSEACLAEKRNAFELRRKKGLAIVPIILSQCSWLDDHEISQLLATPTDGMPISDFNNKDKGWVIVYEALKDVVDELNQIKSMEITDEFSSFLRSTDMLRKAHSQKQELLLDDIYVFPEIKIFDSTREYIKSESSEQLVKNFVNYSKVVIAGENQSGRTSLCKKIFIELRRNNFIPIYLSGATGYQGLIENQIQKQYKAQYKARLEFNDIDKAIIVPILDDFHLANQKETHIQNLSGYHLQILIVDDIYSLNFKNESNISYYAHFQLKEYRPTLRNELIKKWIYLSDETNKNHLSQNELYERIDHKTELVNTALGKVIGSGIMPSYPFFILSVISTYETFEKPLDQEITSQGHCYQALIYLYLRKQGVKNDEIDTYINFLTEFGFFIYSAEKHLIPKEEFTEFMNKYLDKYNLPLTQENLISNLRQTNIIKLDSFNNYSFCYRYLYYFFVAKYLSEHVTENKVIIDTIINNLHKEENAYISIFISHHSRNDYILEELLLNAYCLFDKYKPATLSVNDLGFFDQQVDIILKAALPSRNTSSESERVKRLVKEDAVEETRGKNANDNIKEKSDVYAKKLRTSFKTVEVMGIIIKNRAGSLEKSRLIEIFQEAMRIPLRILESFFEIIRDEDQQQGIVTYISERLDKIIEEKSQERKKEGKKYRKPSQEELKKLSKRIFWNLNFFVVFNIITKIIQSIGSSKLTNIIEKVCDNENTPAAFLVKHGIFMWYNKNLQIDNITKIMEEDGFSKTATKMMRYLIVNHCSMHSLDYKDYQKIEHHFKIPSKNLLIQRGKRLKDSSDD